MRKLIGKTTIILAIILSLIGTQAILPLQVSAANQPLDYDNPNKGGNNPFKLSFNVVTPQLLTSVVSCTGIENKIASKLIALNDAIQKELNNLTKLAEDEVKKLLSSKAERLALEAKIKKTKKDITTALAAIAVVLGVIPSVTESTGPLAGIQAETSVPLDTTQKVQDEVATELAKKAAKDKIIADAKVAKDKKVETCLNGIAVALAKNQLTSMTKYTMNWINSGFNGDPLFVTNVDSFMTSINDQILKGEINLFKSPNNTTSYPYGRDFAQTAIDVNQSAKNFQNTMKQDLTNYLTAGKTLNDYSSDFSVGGWDAWFAMTQQDKNNPLGFTQQEAQYIAQKQGDTVQNTKEEINRGGGVLDQKKCVLWQVHDQTDIPQVNKDGSPVTTTSPSGMDACIKFETVTPGSSIKTKIDTYVNTPERQLELVKTMDDALNALFSALIAQFENQGLTGLKSSVNNFTYTNAGGFGINQVFDTNGNSLTPSGTSGGLGIPTTGDGYFDLTKDLGNTYTISATGKLTVDRKGVIQIQHDYLDKVDNSKTILASILPTVGKLDYCIPGPNPSWRNNAQDPINAYLDSIDFNVVPPIDPGTLDQTLNDYETQVNSIYGANSPMQDSSPGNAKYLQMSQAGLAITKNLNDYADTVATAQEDYASFSADNGANMVKLNQIKDKVNVIIAAAQARRATKRSQDGLPAVKQACLTSEKVTYLDGDVIK